MLKRILADDITSNTTCLCRVYQFVYSLQFKNYFFFTFGNIKYIINISILIHKKHMYGIFVSLNTYIHVTYLWIEKCPLFRNINVKKNLFLGIEKRTIYLNRKFMFKKDCLKNAVEISKYSYVFCKNLFPSTH